MEIQNFILPGNYLTCIYGKPATGKTNICIAIAAHYSKLGKVAFIDTENTFIPTRFKELGGNLDNLIVYNAKTFSEQLKSVQSLVKIASKLKLVVVDSLTRHYRGLIKENHETNSKFSKHLSELSDLTRKNVPVLLTSQVYSTEKNIEMIGSGMLRNWSAAIVRLENEPKRSALIEKHPVNEIKSINLEIKANEICCL